MSGDTLPLGILHKNELFAYSNNVCHTHPDRTSASLTNSRAKEEQHGDQKCWSPLAATWISQPLGAFQFFVPTTDYFTHLFPPEYPQVLQRAKVLGLLFHRAELCTECGQGLRTLELGPCHSLGSIRAGGPGDRLDGRSQSVTALCKACLLIT